MLDDYFDDAEFFKLTGDGMMIVYGFDDEDSLVAKLRKAIESSRRLVEHFSTITGDDPMINFSVPPNIGVGLARGSATVIFSGDTILDFTGRPLNLAARLMDLARPSGIVFDASLGIELLEEEAQRAFGKAAVYIKGIAEEQPIDVYFLSSRTRIPEYSRLPITPPVRVTEREEKHSAKQLTEMDTDFQIGLSREPARLDDAKIHFSYPRATANGQRHPSIEETGQAKVKIERKLNRWYAIINFKAIARQAERQGCKPDWKVTSTIEYSVRDDRSTDAGS